jgi:hypothetical protein
VRKRTVLAVCATLLLVAWQCYASAKLDGLLGDFRAFYCAGAAVAHGANPYMASALIGCERAPAMFDLARITDGLVVPAPLPGYALLFFAGFGLLPYTAASALWLLLSIAAAFWSARALGILLKLPFEAGIVAFAAAFAVNAMFGELASIAVPAMLAAALALRARAWTAAAAAAGVAMIWPHVAAPMMLAMFVFVPQMRARIVVTGLVLAGLDLLCGGPRVAFSYVRDVLPAHARSEIASTSQYGLTWILHALHASDRVALAAGDVSYAAMVIFSLAAVGILMRRNRDLALPALLPPALAVFGGPFIHYTQIVAAIPVALLLYARSEFKAARALFGAAALLLIVPWLHMLAEPLLIPVYAFICGAAAVLLLDLDTGAALRIAFAASLLCAAILFAAHQYGPGISSHVRAVAYQSGLAENSWADFIRQERASTTLAWWFAKAPTWLGLLLLALGCAYVLAKEQFVAPVAVEQVPVAP